MESFKPAGKTVDLWGEGHGFANGASRLTGRTHCQSTQQICRCFILQAMARIGEMWKSRSQVIHNDPETSTPLHSQDEPPICPEAGDMWVLPAFSVQADL
jgi:hypothetical protein